MNALCLFLWLLPPDPSGVYMDRCGDYGIVVTRCGDAYSVQWWTKGEKLDYFGSLRRADPWTWEETWWPAHEPGHRGSGVWEWRGGWRACGYQLVRVP